MQHGLIYPDSAVNWSHPLNRGLVSWWMVLPNRLGGGGNILRDLCRRNHGTLTNGPAWGGSAGRPGGHGRLSFASGSSQRVSIAHHASIALTTFSVEFWFRGTVNGYFIGWYNGATNAGWAIRLVSGALGFETVASGFSSVSTTTTAYSDGVWRHAILTCAGSGSTQQWYTNGQADGSGAIAVNNSAEAKSLGSGTPSNLFSTCSLDGVRYYDRALSASQAAARYAEARQGEPNALNWQRPSRYAPQEEGGGLTYRRYSLTLTGVG